jgi:DNA mismatch endonuclease (patch repair protein)
MRRVRRQDTSSELELRRELHRRGLRYRVHSSVPEVPRVKPDVVFTKHRIAVFVDGCFWHCCPIHGTMPKGNREWWENKLRANVERDLRHEAALRRAGWTVVRIWEHEETEAAATRVECQVVRARGKRDA